MKLTLLDHGPRHPSLGAERRDKGHEHDEANIDHEPDHFGDSSNVLDSILVGETEIPVDFVAHVVAIEEVGVEAAQRESVRGGCIATRRARSSWTAEKRECSRLDACSNCRRATARGAGFWGPNGAGRSGKRRAAPSP